MSCYSGPNTVDDALIFHYDEGNGKSGNTSELVYSRIATVASSTERRFSQDSILATTYASTAQYNNTASGSGFSFSTWIRRTGTTTGTWDAMINIDSGGPRYRMLWFGFYNNVTDQIHCSMPYYSTTDTAVYWSVDPTWQNANLTLIQNQWYNFTATYSNSTRILSTYINSNLARSGTRPGLGDLNNPNGAQIRIYGCNGVSSQNSQVASLQIYNRPLSSIEVLQNFNALRGRFNT